MNIRDNYISPISERKNKMKIRITTSNNENAAIHNASRKFTDLYGDEATKNMIEESKKYGMKADFLSGDGGTTAVIVIPDKIVISVIKIIAKMMNFISIIKPATINLFEDIEDEVQSLEDLKEDQKTEQREGFNPAIAE